ncbi:MAG: 2-dehydropantoate 2-reductase N-terminal domain-containing protein [Eubacteriales bacterium]|nr:2-dehydropantoate 2-reductase N-terminal domain-containing protein [Eubacteriales bacterium]
MRILVFGAGVLGCNLAANLCKAGKDVTLLARGQWYQKIRKNGLTIQNKLTGKVSYYSLPVISELKKHDIYDMIFVAAQYTQLDEIVPVLAENDSQRITFIGNNLNPYYYAHLLAGKQVFFGFALSAGHREEQAVVSIDLKSITVGHLKGRNSGLFIMRQIFQRSGYQFRYLANIEDYLLCHAAIVVPICYACYCVDGDLKRVGRSKSLLRAVVSANREAFYALQKSGVELLPETLRKYRSRWFGKKCYFLYKVMALTFLGQLAAADHAMTAMEEMKALAQGLDAVILQSGVRAKNYWKLKDLQDVI